MHGQSLTCPEDKYFDGRRFNEVCCSKHIDICLLWPIALDYGLKRWKCNFSLGMIKRFFEILCGDGYCFLEELLFLMRVLCLDHARSATFQQVRIRMPLLSIVMYWHSVSTSPSD
jgi:hypothetical protein